MEKGGTMKFQFELTAEQLATLHVALVVAARYWPETDTETKMKELAEFMSHNFNLLPDK